MSTIAIDISSGSMIEAAVVGSSSSQVQVPCAALEAGTFTDEAQFKQDLSKTFEQLKVNPENCKIFISAGALLRMSQAEQTVRIFFDAFKIGAFYISNEAVLALYGANPGKLTGIALMYRKTKIAIVPCYGGISAFPSAVRALGITAHVDELAGVIYDSIFHCDLDVRGELYANIFLFGDHIPASNTYLPDLKEAVQSAAPSVYYNKVNVARPNNAEHLVLQGALSMAGDSFMDSLWFTKAEYQAYGAAFVHRKCSY